MDKCFSSVLQLSFFQKVMKNTSLRHEGMPIQKTQRETQSPPNFGSSFYFFFLLPWGLPYINWASQKCCLFYLRSFWSSDLPLFYFHRLFPSFQPRLCWTPFSYFNCLTFPPQEMRSLILWNRGIEVLLVTSC